MRTGLALVALIVGVVLVACDSAAEPPTSSVTAVAEEPTSTTTMDSLASTTIATTESHVPPAELVFVGGPIVTMDPDLGTVEAIAMSGDTIVAVGSQAEIDAYIGDNTIVVQLAGRTLQPGFVDAHSHVLIDMGGIASGQRLALQNGITSVGEAYTTPGKLVEYRAAGEAGEMVVRTHLYLIRTDACGTDQGRWYEEYPPDAAFGDRVRIAGVKIVSDGGTCNPLGASEPFIEGVDVWEPFHEVDTLVGFIEEAASLGYQTLIHAQGDLAVARVLDAYEIVMDGGENTMRHRIDHNAIVTDDIVGRYSEVGAVPVLFGSSEACATEVPWTDFYKENGEEPGEILAANPDLVFAWHGDDPFIFPVSPIGELFGLVTRGAVAEDGSICPPTDWAVGEGVSVEQGLAMMTTGSAYALRQDEVLGSLTPGRLADLVVLTENLLDVEPTRLHEVAVLMTMVGGVVEYCMEGSEALCPGWTPPDTPTVSASASRSGHGPDLVVDGIVTGESFWSAGEDSPQWIRIDLPERSNVDSIRFVVFQNPPSDTVHELEIQADAGWESVEIFRGFTETGDELVWAPTSAVEGVTAVRMTTLESLSWPEWYEVFVSLE